ncbi:hypothetical protein [Streptomyces yanii]|uniref:Uncharacterized protein n=1 Tax=Streptomyces yanii TaxID=78510 RepID=A0ABV5R5X7_9ACTN
MTGTGATRQLAVAAHVRGHTDLTVEVTGLGGRTAAKTLPYAASAAVRNPTDTRCLTGSSAAVDVGDGY